LQSWDGATLRGTSLEGPWRNVVDGTAWPAFPSLATLLQGESPALLLPADT
jgi:hypothetical protein